MKSRRQKICTDEQHPSKKRVGIKRSKSKRPNVKNVFNVLPKWRNIKISLTKHISLASTNPGGPVGHILTLQGLWAISKPCEAWVHFWQFAISPRQNVKFFLTLTFLTFRTGPKKLTVLQLNWAFFLCQLFQFFKRFLFIVKCPFV